MCFDPRDLPHIVAVVWFVLWWWGYTKYATWKSNKIACLASVLHKYREDWMKRLLLRENRIADTNVIGNLERNASFFASSSLIILAGILTVLGSTERALSVLSELPLVQSGSKELAELKIISIALIFIYSFFTFTWCMRQYNFAATMLGAAPMVSENHLLDSERQAFAKRAANVISMAANQFNLGLRSYYFALATLAWFINPWIYMLATVGVVFVLYHREFHSGILDVMDYKK